MRKAPSPDLYHVATVTADALAESWGGAGVATLLAWGDPAEIELLYCRGLREEVCQALSTGAGRKIVDALRRGGEPVALNPAKLGKDAAELRDALQGAGLEGLLLVPVPGGPGSMGVVCVELPEGAVEWDDLDAVALAQVDQVARAFRALSLAASTSALAVAMAEESAAGGAGVDGVVVLDRWERVIFSHGILEDVPGWTRQGPFGRPVDGLAGGALLADLTQSDSGRLVWEEHLLPPEESGIPVAAAALPFARRNEEAHGRIILFRDLRAEAGGSPEWLLDLALRVSANREATEHPDALAEPGPDTPMARRFDALRSALARHAAEAPRLIAEAVRRSGGDDPRTDLNVTLHRILVAREREFLAEGVRLLRFLRPELNHVPGDPVQLQRVLAGLVEHARASLRPGGGTLTVRTWEEKDQVYLAVSDDGRGVGETASANAFQPLYLSLDPGSRGEHFLEEARACVEPWGGRLMVESRPGLWNRITLMLPGSPVDSESPPSRLPPAVQVQKGEEGLEVLVVDDNPSLRSVMRRYLERRGHTVTEAEDGGRALELLGFHAFDRVVVDVKMPGTDGPTFFKHLDDVAPEMRERIIFMTGGLTERSVESFIDSTGRPAIQKPFDLSEMARAVEG